MIKFLNRVLFALVIVLCVFGVFAAMNFLLFDFGTQDTSSYIYIDYGGVRYSSENSSDGVAVPYGDTVTFAVGNTGSWGNYSVEDCTVRIVPNFDDDHNFEFTVEGNHKSSVYSSVTDLTAAFSVDGGSISVSSAGEFSILVNSADMPDILEAVYGEISSIDGDHYLYEYPYVAIELTSPDGSDTLTIPLWVDIEGVVASGLEFDVGSIVLI